jgi:hypothetical protein
MSRVFVGPASFDGVESRNGSFADSPLDTLVLGSRAALVVAIAIYVTSPAVAFAAAEEPGANEPDWIPSFEFGFDAQFDDRKASVTSNFAPDAASSDTNTITVLRFGTEVLGPKLETRYLGRPRLLLRAGGQFGLVDKDVLVSGDPDPDDPEATLVAAIAEGMIPNPRRDTLADLDPDTIPGQGSYVLARHNKRPTWYASLGAAWEFPAPLYDGWFRIKPAIEYTADEFRYDGLIVEAAEPASDVFEVTRLKQTQRVREHRIGPGLELEAGLMDERPVTVSIFVAARLLFLVSDRTNDWGDVGNVATEIFDDANGRQPGSSAGKDGHFSVTSERHLFRFGGGIRISWMGFD